MRQGSPCRFADMDTRAVLGINACCNLLRRQAVGLGFVLAWCLHASLLVELPIHFRALAPEIDTSMDDACWAQLRSFYKELARQITGENLAAAIHLAFLLFGR